MALWQIFRMGQLPKAKASYECIVKQIFFVLVAQHIPEKRHESSRPSRRVILRRPEVGSIQWNAVAAAIRSN